MSRPLRNTKPEIVHLVTCRTMCAQLLLVPSEEVNDIIGGVFAKYQEEFGIDIFALTVLSNHYHFLSSSSKGELWKFCKNVNRELAKRINWCIGRSGKLWHRPYDDLITITEKDALEGLIYIVTNPTKHGLVEHPKHWPGVNSYFSLASGKPKTYRFTHWTEYSAAKRKAKRSGDTVAIWDYQTEHQLQITTLPYYEKLSLTEQWEHLEPLIEKRRKEITKERKAAGQWFLGRKKVLQQKRTAFPQEVSKSNRPVCYTKDPKLKKEFAEQQREIASWYRKASIKFRLGNYDIKFPPYTLKPPTHEIPVDSS